MVGTAHPTRLNPKHEVPNPKQIQNPKLKYQNAGAGLTSFMSLRGAQRRSNLNRRCGRLLRCTPKAQPLVFLARKTERRREHRAEKNERRRKKEEKASKLPLSLFFAFFRFFRRWFCGCGRRPRWAHNDMNMIRPATLRPPWRVPACVLTGRGLLLYLRW